MSKINSKNENLMRMIRLHTYFYALISEEFVINFRGNKLILLGISID